MRKALPENILIERFKRGEEAALQHFYKLYFRTLVFFAGRLTGAATEAEEIAADAFIKIWKLRENFDSSANIKAFLFISVRNASLNYLRAMKVQVKRMKGLEYLAQEVGEDASRFEMEADVLDQVYREIEKLPTRCKQVFTMIYFEEMSVAQISAALKLSPFTINNHKQRALKLLRTTLLKNPLQKVLFWSSVLLPYWLLVKSLRLQLYHFFI